MSRHEAAGGLRRTPWVLLLLAFPLIEVGAHALTRAGVAPDSDFEAAAAFVRSQQRERDLIAGAPDWIDPRLRLALGDRIDLVMAGRSDDARYERLWAVTIRGALPPEAPARAPDETREFGAVRVSRWDLGPSPVVFDLTEHVAEARVTLGDRPCAWSHSGGPRGGGLGKGALTPTERFVCDRRRDWLWVAPVVMEDLDLQPRRCVYQHPAGSEPVRVEFGDIPLGERLVFYGGLYYEHERMREGGPIDASVTIDGKVAGRMRHVDGDGWKRMLVPTGGRERGRVTIEVRADNPRLRTFCWSATTRRGQARR